MLRAARHWVTAQATAAAVVAAPRLSARAVDRIGILLARCGRYCPVVARNVADNMRALGVYSPEAHRDHFAQLGAHFAGALHALRCAGRTAGYAMSDELADIVAQHVELDESLARVHEVVARGRGAIIMGPHIANYLLNLAQLNQDLPLTVYLRYSKDARRRAARQRWYQATGVGWISEAPSAGEPLGRLGRMSAAISEGRVLFITPDLPQKRDDGTPVRFFDREIYLPPGPALLAVRTGAPLFVLGARASGQRQRLVLRGPFESESIARGREGRRAAVQRRLQWFATCFQQFLAQHTPLWYLWGDKRWTRLLRGDRRYVRPLDNPVPTTTADASGGVAGAG